MESCIECGIIDLDTYGHKSYCKNWREELMRAEAIAEEQLNDKWANDSNPIRPKYYAKYKIDPWTFCMENEFSLAVGSVIKYVVRHQDKNGVEDLNKAIKCIQMMKEHYYNEKS